MCTRYVVTSSLVDHNAAVTTTVGEIIADRLAESGLAQPASDFVLAALLGDADLNAMIAGGAAPAEATRAPSQSADSTQSPHLYLKSIVVQGFRGIGPQAALRLQAGPGLTVIAGRNGSGKSSFAEAAELALTGENMRWAKRSIIWREGWRNLHSSTGSASILVELTANGQPGVMKVTREWSAGAGLDDTMSYAQAHGKPRQQLAAMNWAHDLEFFRPFLSYSELGDLVSGRPSDMYDAIQAILGLDQMVDAEKRLNDVRKRLEEPSKLAAKALPGLRKRLAACPDERAREAAKKLASKPWDLSAIEALAVGGESGPESAEGRLASIAAIDLPAPEATAAALTALHAAMDRAAEFAGTPAADARRLLGLLDAALDHQAHHAGEPCPVCGSRRLDDAWVEQTRAEVSRLRELTREAMRADDDLREASKAVRGLVGAMPHVLNQDLGELDPVASARAAWQSWTELTKDGIALAVLSQEAAARLRALRTAIADLKSSADAEVRRRSEAWQPVAAALAAWAEQARLSESAAGGLTGVKLAIAWIRDAGQVIRDARMEQFTTKSAEIWSILRQESNVDLGPIRLAGTATQRRLTLDVNVDGVGSAALSVMSQGELHALGLTLFLPRATAEESPFRFVVIDDPVQAMDPSKVDGLARLLAKTGESRQVIVFTHDDRLPEAIRRLQLSATIWEVTRREQSVVELRKNEDPVSRYIEDAFAVAQTSELSEAARGVVAAGFCRSALEAACHQVIRTRGIKDGVPYADIERDLLRAQKLRQMIELALLNVPDGDVVKELGKRYGPSAVSAYNAAKDGTHAGYRGDLRQMVRDTERLADRLRA